MRGLLGSTTNNVHLMRTKGLYFYIVIIIGLVVAYYLDYFVLQTFSEGVRESLVTFFAYGLIGFIPFCTLEANIQAFSTKWNTFERTMAISPFVMILSRYILFTVLSALGAAIFMLTPLYDGAFMLVVVYFIMGQVAVITYYPIMYAFNPKKDTIGNYIMMISIGASLAFVFFVMEHMIHWNVFLIIAATAILYVISITIALFFEKLHRARA